MQGCLALGALAIMGWICWEIFVEFLGEVGWFWGSLIALVFIAILFSKR